MLHCHLQIWHIYGFAIRRVYYVNSENRVMHRTVSDVKVNDRVADHNILLEKIYDT